MANTINTRIVLRNDELSAWEESSKVLLKGEVALAKLSGSNEFEMRVGTGDKTWNQLSDSNVITKVKDGSLTWSKMSSDVTNWKSVVEGNIEKLDGDLSELSDKVEGLSTELKGDIAAAKSEAILSAKAYTDEQTAASTGSLYNQLKGEMIEAIGSSNQDNKDYTDGKITALSTELTSTYATKDELSEAKSEVLLSAENYTDKKIAALDFTDTLANLSDEIVKVADESAKAYTDAEVEALSDSLSGTVDSQVSNLYGVIDGHVAVLNTHIQTERDVARDEAILSAKTYTDEQITALTLSVDSTYATKDELSEAKVEAVLSANSYTDTVVEDLSNSISGTVDSLSGTVDSQISNLQEHINASFYEQYQVILTERDEAISQANDYTDEQITALSITDYAKVSALNEVAEKVSTLETGTSALSGRMTAAEGQLSTVDSRINSAKDAAISSANAYTDEKIGSLGDVFNFKGIKNSIEELQAITDAKTGDVYLVGTKEFVYTAKNSWVEFGDGSDHATKTELEKEAQDRKAADDVLSSAIDNKVFIDGTAVKSLSVENISQDDYHNLVEQNQIDPNKVYIVSAETYNMYDQKIINLKAGTEEKDAVNFGQISALSSNIMTEVEANKLSSITLGDTVFTPENNNITLNISTICGGGAKDFD